jgi:hypothetical protein
VATGWTGFTHSHSPADAGKVNAGQGKRSFLGLVLVAATAAALAAPSSRSAAPNQWSRQAATGFPGGPYFNVVCGFSHRKNDDPIMHQGHPGASHNHTYTGNLTVDASSTSASLRGGSTTCDLPEDASGYWAPTLYVGTEAILPLAGIVYYVRRTTADVTPFPADLRMIAGNATARGAQPKNVVSWGCGGIGGSVRFALVPACTEDQMLELRVQFPNRWNAKTSGGDTSRCCRGRSW